MPGRRRIKKDHTCWLTTIGSPGRERHVTEGAFTTAICRRNRCTSAALITAPFIRTAAAAGKLSIGFWDHWVPGANDTCTNLCNEWAAREKVEISIDYITSRGKKGLLTIAAEAAAKSGHDVLQMPTWWPHAYSEQIEPVNDIMEPLIKQNGEVNGTVQYPGDKWLGSPQPEAARSRGPAPASI
jgi:ABC-type glycerol-3-phosphate transport system substrate-binding protein